MFQNRKPVWVFLYHCISEGNRLSSENFGFHFHFILRPIHTAQTNANKVQQTSLLEFVGSVCYPCWRWFELVVVGFYPTEHA